MIMITTWIAAAIAGWLVLILPAAAQTPTHPLAGKILDTRTGAITELTDPALIPKLFPCGAITLLGEVHDNAAHHEMRATLIRSLQQGIDKTCGAHAYVLEHISADQQAGLDKLDALDKQARRLATASDLFRFLDWDKSGWPAARIFATLIQEVVDSRRPILAGNPARDATRKVAKEGVGALDPQLARRLGLDRPLDAPLADDLLGELEASHCGVMPKSAFTNMAAAQRYRDAYMADVALDCRPSPWRRRDFRRQRTRPQRSRHSVVHPPACPGAKVHFGRLRRDRGRQDQCVHLWPTRPRRHARRRLRRLRSPRRARGPVRSHAQAREELTIYPRPPVENSGQA